MQTQTLASHRLVGAIVWDVSPSFPTTGSDSLANVKASGEQSRNLREDHWEVHRAFVANVDGCWLVLSVDRICWNPLAPGEISVESLHGQYTSIRSSLTWDSFAKQFLIWICNYLLLYTCHYLLVGSLKSISIETDGSFCCDMLVDPQWTARPAAQLRFDSKPWLSST